MGLSIIEFSTEEQDTHCESQVNEERKIKGLRGGYTPSTSTAVTQDPHIATKPPLTKKTSGGNPAQLPERK